MAGCTAGLVQEDVSYVCSFLTIHSDVFWRMGTSFFFFLLQQHETFLPNGDRAGFLIGDGAGVGKGRTIAGIIYENYLLGRKRAVW